ncbi:unnamed protein product [Pelagomonas calceolata]|uniref:Uncharacterized protein n=1 Tax=Pelagomonas calceolata TaxID=35677 RepID=A0A8J2X111_9STRA|nr:unnamed protein product [Pelagomonas calceolata]
MSELDVHLAAAYLKRVSLSSSALDELLEEESTRKLRRVSSSNNLEEGQNRRARRPATEALDALLVRLEERRALGPVELGRCSELADATDEFVRRGLFDALVAALDRNVWSELGALVDVHRRARPYDLRDDLRRAICVNRQEAVKRRLAGDEAGALEAMRDFKKCQWQLKHVIEFFDAHIAMYGRR